jgi:tetratricopeptide (TPR) repeat protein
MKKLLMTCLALFLVSGLAFGEDQFSRLKATADAVWGERDNLDQLKKCIEAYEKALQIKPDNQTILSRLSIGHFWIGNLHQGSDFSQFRMDTYQKGMNYAKKLVKINPKSAPGIFWDATNNAAYCKEKGFMKSAINVGTIKEQAKKVMEIERYYYRGGPQRLLARVYWGTPRFFRKWGEGLQDGADLLNEALSKHPNFTLSYIFLGDIYWEMGEKEKARKTFEKVFSIPENAVPEISAENRRDRKTAKKKLREYFGL